MAHSLRLSAAVDEDPEMEEFQHYINDDDESHGMQMLFPEVPPDEEEFDGIIDSDIEDNDDDEDESDMDMSQDEADVQTFRAKDGTIWTTKTPSSRIRTHGHNIVSDDSHPKDVVPVEAKMADIFRLFFNDELLDMIMEHSNSWGRFVVAQNNSEEGGLQYDWTPIDKDELLAFIGLQVWLGMERNSKYPIDSLWSTDPLDSRPIFPATIGRNRFKTLTRVLRFDDAVARRIRLEQDSSSVERGEPVRELMSMFNTNTRALYEPGPHLTVDETLIPFRGRAPFRVYMKTKPGRYGLKLWNIADSKTSYVLGLQLYEGKRPGAQREYNQGKRVVMELAQPYFGSNRGVTTDNFFTSMALAKDLAQKNLTLLGTIRKTRREVPVPLREKKGREEFSSLFVFHENATLVSYKPRGLKDVVMALSTSHHDRKISDEDHKKPEIILDYNATKGGVDTADQMISEYTSQRPTRRWPMKIFYSLIDMVTMNSFKIYSARTQTRSRMKAMRELALDLMWEHQKKRAATSRDKRVIASLMLVAESRGKDLPLQMQPSAIAPRRGPDPGGPSQRRCEIHEGSVSKRPQTRISCQVCHRFVCGEHRMWCCYECRPPLPQIPEEETSEIDD